MPLLIILAFSHFLVDVMIAILPPLEPLLTERLGLSLVMYGTLVGVISVCSGIMQPLFGHLIDRRGMGWTLPVTFVVVSVGAGLVGVLADFYALLALVAVMGAAAAFFHPAGMVMVRHTLKGRMGTAMAVFSVGGSIGTTLAVPIVLILTRGWGLAGLLFLIIPGILLAVLTLAAGVHRLPGRVIRRPARPDANYEGGPATPELQPPIGPLLKLGSAILTRSMMHAAVTTYVLTYFRTAQGFTYEEAAMVLMLYKITGPFGALAGGFLADRWGRKATTVFSQIVSPLILLGALMMSGWAAAGMMALSGFFLSLTFSVAIVYGQELVPNNPATVSGFITGFAWGTSGLILVPLAMAAEIYGLAPGFAALAVVSLLSTVLLFSLPETVPRWQARPAALR